jgi:indolepyruvate ferredoxin oxidoreductase
LPDQYLALVEKGLGRGRETALAVAELADIVRGYEDIKLANVERFRARAAELLA